MRKPDDFHEEIRAHVELEADRLRVQGLVSWCAIRAIRPH
jgi:hypothetical protein